MGCLKLTYREKNEAVLHVAWINPKLQNRKVDAYVNNNPIWYNDPLGDEFKNPIKGLVRGISNVVSGRPWNAKHATNLGSKIKREKEDVFVRKGGGLVTEKYLSKLHEKAESSEQDPNLAWAKRLSQQIESTLMHELDVKEPGDLSDAGNPDNDLHNIPEVSKVYNASLIPMSFLSGGQHFALSRNEKSVFSATGFTQFDPILFKVRSGDDIKLSLSRVQPLFYITNRPEEYSESDIPSSFKHAVSPIHSFQYQIKLSIKQ